MRKLFKAIVLAAAALFSAPAAAQTPGGAQCPYIAFQAVLTAAQWQYCFQIKQDYLGFTPLNIAGGTMTGPLITAPSTATAAGFNVPPGVAPTTPNNGDIWVTAAGMFVRINGGTIQLSTGGVSLAPGGTNQIPYYSAPNTISALSSLNNAVLITGPGGLPALSTTLPGALTIPSPTFSGTVAGSNTIPVSVLAQDPTAWSLLGNATGAAANYVPFTIGGLTQKATPTTSDLVMIQDQAAAGALKSATLSSIAGVGVSSLGQATGALDAPVVYTAAHSVVGSDCEQPILLGGYAQFTLTVGAPNSYLCSHFIIHNIDAYAGAGTGRGKLISATGLASSFFLYPGVQADLKAKTASVTASIGAATFSVTGSIAGKVLTVSAVSSGNIVNGATISGTGVTGGTTIVNQISGTAQGIGSYIVSVSQTVASTTISGSYTAMTVTAVGSGSVLVGDILSGTGVSGGSKVTALGTGTGGTGTYVVTPAQTASSTTITSQQWQTNTVQRFLAPSLQIFVDNAGSDTANDGLSYGSTNAFATFARCAGFMGANVDTGDTNLQCSHTAGQTDTEFVAFYYPTHGGGTLTFNSATPGTQFTWLAPTTQNVLQFGDGALVGLADVQMSMNNGTVISGHNHGVLDSNTNVTIVGNNGSFAGIGCDFDTHFNINNGLVYSGTMQFLFSGCQGSRWNINGALNSTGTTTLGRTFNFASGSLATFQGNVTFGTTGLTTNTGLVTGGAVVNNLSGSVPPGGAPTPSGSASTGWSAYCTTQC